MRQIEILDSSLRDGAQAEGIFYSLEDKLRIAYALDRVGIGYIEAGNPASNPKDMELFRRIAQTPFQHAKLVAFGATRRPGIAAEQDAGCAALAEAGTEFVSVFGKSWDLHVTEVLKTSLAENLEMIRDTVSYFTRMGKHVFFDAEHFFDGYRHHPAISDTSRFRRFPTVSGSTCSKDCRSFWTPSTCIPPLWEKALLPT